MMSSLTKDKPPLAVGDRYVVLPGSETQRACDDGFPVHMAPGGTTYLGTAVLRLDERHPCGALEFVVIAVDDVA